MQTTLNLDDITNQVAEATGMSKAESKRYATALLNGIKDAVNDGNAVRLAHFGKFEPVTTSPRSGVAPNGTPYQTQGKSKVKFKASSEFLN